MAEAQQGAASPAWGRNSRWPERAAEPPDPPSRRMPLPAALPCPCPQRLSTPPIASHYGIACARGCASAILPGARTDQRDTHHAPAGLQRQSTAAYDRCSGRSTPATTVYDGFCSFAPRVALASFPPSFRPPRGATTITAAAVHLATTTTTNLFGFSGASSTDKGRSFQLFKFNPGPGRFISLSSEWWGRRGQTLPQ